MRYVDGYVLPVAKKHLKAYLRMAREGERLWRKHGALDYKECVGDDLKPKWGLPFTRVMKLKPGETVVERHALRHEANGLRGIQGRSRRLAVVSMN